MSHADQQACACVNCQRSDAEVPVTEWRLAGGSFWVCPDCLPQLIHHRAQVMSRWGLAAPAPQGAHNQDASQQEASQPKTSG